MANFMKGLTEGFNAAKGSPRTAAEKAANRQKVKDFFSGKKEKSDPSSDKVEVSMLKRGGKVAKPNPFAKAAKGKPAGKGKAPFPFFTKGKPPAKKGKK